MKVKFGDLTINQTIEICKGDYYGACNHCPLYHKNFGCIAYATPCTTKLYDLQDWEIDLPDEEESENGKTDL